ncbi:hypothetical protein [Glutamicibacter sp. BW80]|uniref:SCO6745 family protein n=1 Tax=Glutamicibacter sp. BW80 TaxID=2024404 RepID=UPI000BB7131B|nr:hypothetical protein [Glutamicibacter sp. BW80]
MDVYLAGRLSPAGIVSGNGASSLLYSFSAAMLNRRVPLVWDAISPAAAIEARFVAIDRTLTEYLPADLISGESMVLAASLARKAADACAAEGRPMFGALKNIEYPEPAYLALWHACTLLREYRGDGHIDVLREHGLSGIQSLVFHSSTPMGMPMEVVREKRGWSVKDWTDAAQSLASLGLLNGAGQITDKGLALHWSIESETDTGSRQPFESLGITDTRALSDLMQPMVRAMVSNGLFPTALLNVFVTSENSEQPSP